MMNLSQFIINDIEPLDKETSIRDVQQLFNQLTYSHFPILQDAAYIGCLTETDAHWFDTDKKINNYKYALEGFFVWEDTNWLDVLEAFAQNSTNIMPVLDKNNQYLGYYELNDIIGLFNDTPFFSGAGSFIIVEKGINDYSFSEVSQIVESNNGKLLGAFISKSENDLTQITLKISNQGLNDILHAFRRYGYNIVSGHENDSYTESLKERSEYLNKFLNI